MKKLFILPMLVSALLANDAAAFCGFYVAKGDSKLFNKASRVVLVRDGDRTVLTMANDFRGELKEFAIVIPVPTVLEKNQIHIGDTAVLDHLDAYSAPRLVEYFDPNPCEARLYLENAQASSAPKKSKDGEGGRAKALGVKIEAQYTVGEYDIIILAAQQSDGLETWLKESGYRIPDGASRVLGGYIKQGMKFFVAKVNLKEQAKLGFTFLRPIQIAYESPKFMLPIRLGMVNADGPQELFVFALTRKGRVETTNYRTVKLPSDVEIPLFIKDKDEFAKFYRAMFSAQVKKEDMRTIFTEYAWDMAWCDPCAAEPLSQDELRKLGVFWLGDGPTAQPFFKGGVQAQNVFVTRLHVRYDREHFPEDLVFQETGDRQNFQGRYILRHPWKGNDNCDAAKRYREELPKRFEKEAQQLASLTGWDVNDIRKKMNLDEPSAKKNDPWWKKIWGD